MLYFNSSPAGSNDGFQTEVNRFMYDIHFQEQAEIELWYFDLARLALDTEDCYACLDEHEQQTARRFKFEHLQLRYQHNHALVRRVLALYLDCAAVEVPILRSKQGKPYLDSVNQTLAFNYSHSGTALLLGVARQHLSLGVDIESIKPREQFTSVAKRCFAEAEYQSWLALPCAEQQAAFFTLWTRKEAFVKAVGQGLYLGLDQCVSELDAPGKFVKVPESCGNVQNWRFADVQLEVSQRAAVVTASASLNCVMQDICQVL